jgi:hypothetical protein
MAVTQENLDGQEWNTHQPVGVRQDEIRQRRFHRAIGAAKVFSSIWAVESEVNNGGFSQYFLNSSSETAGFVVEALETIDAPRTADICRRAIAAAFPDG